MAIKISNGKYSSGIFTKRLLGLLLNPQCHNTETLIHNVLYTYSTSSVNSSLSKCRHANASKLFNITTAVPDQKLFKKRFRLNIRKYSFGNRGIDNRNLLSADCVHCKTVNTFKNHLSPALELYSFETLR